MRFAIVDNVRVEAAPQLTGLCPGCNKPVVAKCGTQRIHHWAHRGNNACDSWWEPETEWHRSWKSNFPDEWQEVIFRDEVTGEKHIADLHTVHDMVVEFQHSRIDPSERNVRENFYKNMVWVVNGTRLKRNHHRFVHAKDHFFQMSSGSYLVNNPEQCLPTDWLTSPIPVVFDFRSSQWFEGAFMIEHDLYCLFPVRIGTAALLEKIPAKAFVNDVTNGASSLRLRSFLKDKNQFVKDLQGQIAMLQRMHTKANPLNFRAYRSYKRSWRF